MTSDTRTPEEIEREIERKRSNLSSNLEELQDKFSIDTVVRQISEQFREHGGDVSRSIANQVKANPIPLALTGIGLAWLMFGNSQPPQPQPRQRDEFDYDRYSEVERDFRRSREARGLPYTPPTRYDAPPLSGSTPSWARDDDMWDDGDDGPSMGDRLASGAGSVRDTAAGGARAVRDGAVSGAQTVRDGAVSGATAVRDTTASGAQAAREKAAAGAHAVKEGLSTAGSAVAGAASTAGAKVGGAAQAARDGLYSAGSRIAEGTEHLTEEGRRRVIAARRKAVEMRHAAARSMRDSGDAAADFYDRQPLVVGALALAVGAALGGALPRTKTEDDLMGAQSDRLFDEAERIFQEEKAKALRVADEVKKEVGDIAAETRAEVEGIAARTKAEVKDIASRTKAEIDGSKPGQKSAVEAVADKARDAAERVADKAKAEAEKTDLGNPKT